MQLFDAVTRTNMEPKRRDESTFEYLNASARSDIGVIRDTLEQWFGGFPQEHRNILHTRFRDRNSFDAAFNELFLNEFFRRLGYSVVVEPTVPGISKHPDFLLSKESTEFYAEATIAYGTSQDERSNQNLKDRVLEAIDQIPNLPFWLGMKTKGSCKTTPSTNQIKHFINQEIKKINPATLDKQFRENGLSGLPEFIFQHEEWVLTFTAFPKGSAFGRSIGFQMGDAEEIKDHEAALGSLKDKVSRYGQLPAPYLICLNSFSMFFDEETILQTLFGSLSFEISDTNSQVGYSGEGAFLHRGQATNTRMSAILFLWNLHPHSVHKANAVLVHHPNAAKPLPAEALPVPQISFDEKFHILRKRGLRVSEIMGLPDGWGTIF